MEGKAGTKQARDTHAPINRPPLGADQFDFLGVVGVGGEGDFRKEYHFLKTDSEEENSCKGIPGKKKSDTVVG